MIKLCAPFSLLFLWVPLVLGQVAPEPPAWEVESKSGVEWELATGVGTATNGVVVKYGEAVLTARKATLNQKSGDVYAEGSVHIQRDNQTWAGEKLHYNFLTHQMDGQEFRTGKSPFFAAGQGLHGDPTNRTYMATNGYFTTDDFEKPFIKVHASYIKIVPGQYFEAKNATVLVGGVPVFYFPYYHRALGDRQNNFSFLPGYRSAFGPFFLTTYNWFAGDNLDGMVHMDWREKRGLGGGPDFGFHLGKYGDGILRYYYAHDDEPGLDPNFRASFGDHELGKVSFFGGRGGMRLASWQRAQADLGLQPHWRVELGRYVLLSVTSSLVALPVFAADTLPAELPEWQRLRELHMEDIRQTFAALQPDQRVLLFCHDPTALPFLWREEAVREKLPQLEQTIIGHLHSNLVFWKSRLLAGMPPIRFLGHTAKRMTTALSEGRHWRPFRVRLCPSLAGIELLKDGGYYTATLDADAIRPAHFQFHPLPR